MQNTQHLLVNKTGHFKCIPGTSLVVQWLGLCTPKAGGLGWIPGQGTRSHMPQRRLKIAHSQIHKINKYWKYFKKPLALTVKNLPEMQETQDWSLGLEDPLKKEMVTQSSILAWEIPRTEEPGVL